MKIKNMKKEFIDGKKISEEVVEKLRSNFSIFQKEKKRKISLGVFVAGKDPVIKSFVKIKEKNAEKIGIDFKIFNYDEKISEGEFIKSFLKKQEKVDGVIIQLPLPENFNVKKILSKINRKKDVDYLNLEEDIEKVKKEKIDFNKKILAPVSAAIFKIIKSVNYNFLDKKIVIVGKGMLVGKPFSEDLKRLSLKENKNFFFIDSKTFKNDKKKLLKTADIIISGVGISNFIKKEDIKEGVFLIDAGTSTANKKLIGDISLDCLEKASYFSKTPGGVGPLTVVSLYENLWKLVNFYK